VFVTDLYSPLLAALPLLLWKTPPGLELILAQEGVPFEIVKDPHPLSFRAGRFVLYDSRSAAPLPLRSLLGPDHVMIDVDDLRRDEPADPFAALVDDRTARASWTVGPHTLSERIARVPKAWIRRRLIAKLRAAVATAGGVWIQLAAFPYPYRSAFSFRADLDESLPEDYRRFAAARDGLGSCCTHFVSTHAYTHHLAVLKDLRNFDTQSHGHFHHIYRDPEANRANVERAHRILSSSGFEPVGFAAPHGRWQRSLDDQLEDLGYLYSSDFQIGYDDLPFFPWKADRFSRILQIPVHPVCEGLFLEAGASEPRVIAEYLRAAVAAKLDAGQLAIVYGHPERRLGRMPEILLTLADELESRTLLWRATFTELSRWWRWRAGRRWLVIPRPDNRLDIQFDEWDTEYDLSLEIWRGRFRCSLPVTGPRMSLGLSGLVYERQEPPDAILEPPAILRDPITLRRAVRAALDWETVTPIDDIPRSSVGNRFKRGLRRWQQKRTGTMS
jgi:peptidoglycan/xylan/chitin deacetylase (PgdA/CDA1 family)